MQQFENQILMKKAKKLIGLVFEESRREECPVTFPRRKSMAGAHIHQMTTFCLAEIEEEKEKQQRVDLLLCPLHLFRQILHPREKHRSPFPLFRVVDRASD